MSKTLVSLYVYGVHNDATRAATREYRRRNYGHAVGSRYKSGVVVNVDGDAIRKLIVARYGSVSAFATVVGIWRATIRQALNRGTMRENTLSAICDALGIHESEVVRG